MKRLTPEQQELVEELTGERYEYGSACTSLPDSPLCLYNNEVGKAVIVNHSTRSDIDPAIDSLEEIEIIRDGNHVIAGYEASDNIRVNDLFRDIDRPASVSVFASDTAVEAIPRSESQDMQTWRLAWAQSLFKELTPELADRINLIDLRGSHLNDNPDAVGRADSLFGWIKIFRGDLEFDITFFHEAAHTHTGRISSSSIKRWKDMAGDIYLGKKLDNVDVGSEALLEWLTKRGVVSEYSLKSPEEDISELTAEVYTCPGYVRFLASKSKIICDKLSWLKDEHYISKEQYEQVTDPEANAKFITEWQAVAGDVYGRIDPEKTRVTDSELDAAGLVHSWATMSPSQDIFLTISCIRKYPNEVRSFVERSPIFAQKIELLAQGNFITEAEYRYVMSQDRDAISARPESDPVPCSLHTDTWIEAAACYLDQGGDALANSFPDFAGPFISPY